MSIPLPRLLLGHYQCLNLCSYQRHGLTTPRTNHTTPTSFFFLSLAFLFPLHKKSLQLASCVSQCQSCMPTRPLMEAFRTKAVKISIMTEARRVGDGGTALATFCRKEAFDKTPSVYKPQAEPNVYARKHPTRERIAQSVERWTEKPGTVLMLVRFPGAARDFSPGVDCQCRISYGVLHPRAYNHMHQHLQAR